jgi:uroporphyrinogen-III synthase
VRVWLTRTQPGADRQARALAAAGYQAVVAPVLTVRAVPSRPPRGPFDWVIFLSEHAVRFGFPALEASGGLTSAGVLAVGARTAAALGELGITALAPEQPTSEGLLELDELTRVRGRRVLLVRGVGGRTLLADVLAGRGADVEQFECYRREAADAVDVPVAGCDVIVAGSGDGLREAARLWWAAGGRADVAVLVPSGRVAELAVALGFSRIHDCGGADEGAVLAGLRQLDTTEPS